MANVKVLTDSLADIPPAILQELDIAVVPTIVRFGETEYRDRIDLFPSEFFQLLTRSDKPPSTSQPASGVFEETFRRLATKTDQILAIHTDGLLSGIYNASCAAAANVPDIRIRVMDSRQVSMALGWLVILAARAARQGHTLDQLMSVVQDAMPRVHLIAMLDTLEYARRGGRLGKASALLGTLLNVKPLLSVVHGEVVPVENVRSQKRALERLVEIAMSSGPIQELSVIHALAPEPALKVRQMLADSLPNGSLPKERIVMAEAGPVLGAHVGPGTVGIAWLNGVS
jgi:DegV family protein with EDD domain